VHRCIRTICTVRATNLRLQFGHREGRIVAVSGVGKRDFRQSAEPLDSAAANMQKGLRVFLRDGAPLDAVAKRLEPAPRATHANGDGEVSVVLLLQKGTEVEVKLPGRFKVSPQIAGAIKAVPGVVQVEAL